MICNLTPHALHIFDQDGGALIQTIPSSGGGARVSEIAKGSALTVDGVPVSEFAFSQQVAGLPTEESGIFYVVSLLTAVALLAAGVDRSDILVPGPEVRDRKGQIFGCRELRRLKR